MCCRGVFCAAQQAQTPTVTWAAVQEATLWHVATLLARLHAHRLTTSNFFPLQLSSLRFIVDSDAGRPFRILFAPLAQWHASGSVCRCAMSQRMRDADALCVPPPNSKLQSGGPEEGSAREQRWLEEAADMWRAGAVGSLLLAAAVHGCGWDDAADAATDVWELLDGINKKVSGSVLAALRVRSRLSCCGDHMHACMSIRVHVSALQRCCVHAICACEHSTCHHPGLAPHGIKGLEVR